MVTEEADELLTPEALRVLCPSPEAERNQALGEALEAAYQCALISSYGKEPGPRGIWTVQRCGEPEVLLSALDAARWLSVVSSGRTPGRYRGRRRTAHP